MSSTTPATERTYKVLIVEDDAQILRVLELELKHEGYEVETARDGLSGLERALKEPDLVVLDLMLPKLDGMEVCARIRAKSNVPIIMLTAKDRIPDRVAGLDHGADDYLTKPFSIEELLARIRARLRDRNPHDNVIGANESIRFDIRQTFLCGEEVANVGTIRIGFAGGGAVEVDGVYCYRRSGDGKLAGLRAFWEPDQIRSVE